MATLDKVSVEFFWDSLPLPPSAPYEQERSLKTGASAGILGISRILEVSDIFDAEVNLKGIPLMSVIKSTKLIRLARTGLTVYAEYSLTNP